MSPPPPTSAPAPRHRRGLRLLLAALLAIGGALSVVWGINWWNDWPLREGEAALEADDPTRAEALARFYLDGHADDARGLSLRARALVKLGRSEEAVGIYEKVQPASADDLHALAAGYLMMESWSRAKPILTVFLESNPGDADALYELATCTARLGQLKEAVVAAQQLAAAPGMKAQGLFLQAIFRQDLGDSAAAAEAYQQLIAEVPDAAELPLPPHEIFLQYGNTLLDQGNAADAIAQFQRSIAIEPTGEAFFRLGRAMAQDGNQDAAITAWTEAVAVQPDSVSPREALAEAALANGDADAAEAWLGPLTDVATQRAETAYLFQRLAASRNDTAAFAEWKAAADTARQRQQRDRLLDQFVLAAPANPWATCVRAHRFASAGNIQQANDLLAGLPVDFIDDPFVRDLRRAIESKSELPSLDRVPVNEP